MSRSGKVALVVFSLVVFLFVLLFSLTGFYVVQPIGAIPEGITVWYLRLGLNLPFVSSADGILLKSDNGVSLFSRGMMNSTVIGLIKEKILLRLPYIDVFYNISTKGVKFEN